MPIVPRDHTTRNLPQVWPYIDTCEAYIPFLRPEQLQRLRRDWRMERCRRGFGFKIICNQESWTERKRLTPARLKRLDYICRIFHGVLSRVDLALDVQCDDPEALCQQIRSQAILRWKRTGLMYETEHVTYWEPTNRSGKSLRRNLVLYSDKHNKITGELDCVHLELRLYQAQVIRNQGIRKPSDLIRINPRDWFNKHVKWSVRADDRRTKSIRSATEKANLRPNDPYYSNLPRRADSQLKRMGLDKSQVFKSRNVMEWRKQNRRESRTKNHTIAPFGIPTQLEWKVDQDQVVVDRVQEAGRDGQGGWTNVALTT